MKYRLLTRSIAATRMFFKNRLASSGLTASAGGEPPASPAETSLQTLTRLVLSWQDSEGNPAQSMVLKCGGYVKARFLGQPCIGRCAEIGGGEVQIGRCQMIFDPYFAPDQWHLAIFPKAGKADLYEGFVE